MARDKLTQGMASIGHILLGNHEVIHTNGSVLITSVGNLGPMVEPFPEQRFHNQWDVAC